MMVRRYDEGEDYKSSENATHCICFFKGLLGVIVDQPSLSYIIIYVSCVSFLLESCQLYVYIYILKICHVKLIFRSP